MTATITVTPGEVLTVIVGGQNGNGGGFGGGGPGGAGGFNGGADGGNSVDDGGGGASDVRQGGAAPADRVVVGGGGGGGGSSFAAALGAEGVFRIRNGWAWFIRGGRLSNVAPADLATRAQRIATAVGATADVTTRVTGLTAGLRLSWEWRRWTAYTVGAAGVARVRQETTFSAGGTAVVPGTQGIQLGADLDGSVTKPTLVAGGGVTVPAATRTFVDLGVRYIRIMPRPSQIPRDQGINAVRLHAGLGVRF